MERISMEQVLAADPQVLVVQEKELMGQVYSDARWQGVRGVRDKRVYLIPRSPFNWFDRPPSYMRYIGIQWLMKSLYPGDYRVDLVAQTRSFYRLFFRLELSDEQIREILAG